MISDLPETLADTPLFQGDDVASILGAATVLHELEGTREDRDRGQTAFDWQPTGDEARLDLLQQCGVVSLDDVRALGPQETAALVARADGLVRRGTLAEALDGLDRRLDALGPPLRDLVTDWLRVEAMPWWQLEEILRKHSRLDREEIRSCPLWWRRPRVRDVLARRIVEALPADSGLGYVSDAGDMFQLGRVVAATRRADPGGELWPVFHLDASPGGYSANGLFVKPDSPVARDLPAFATAGCSELGELAWAPRRYAEHGYILIFDQTIARSGLHVGRHAAGALDPGVARHLERRHGDLTALVEDPSALEATVAEYVIAHELGHARYHRPDRQNHPTAEAWANQGALELLIPWLGQSERAHLELLAAKKLNRFERIFQADAPESLFHVQDAILLPALLTSDPVTTHRTHTQRLQEILGDPEKLLEENQELGLGYVRGVVRETLGGGRARRSRGSP